MGHIGCDDGHDEDWGAVETAPVQHAPRITVNVNQEVWVRLTPKGRAHLVAFYAAMNLPEQVMEFCQNPHEVNGQAKFILWELMQIFGSRMSNGGDLMFETKIEIEAFK